MTPRERALAVEEPAATAADDERFAGYGVMAQPFRSGHVLAMRRFVHSSIGPAYSSVWHGDPDGRWTIWADIEPDLACPRYFGPALDLAEERPIDVGWTGDDTLAITVADRVDWRLRIVRTPATATMSAVGSVMPERLWRSPAVLGAMGRVAGPFLRAGTLRLAGDLPSTHTFRLNPRLVWATADVDATVLGEPLGPTGRSDPQRWLGGFAIPDRGLFAIGAASFASARR